LRVTSIHGIVFVGDAGLSPGVKNYDIYAALSQLYMAIYEDLGVPLVNQAPGVELESDGLHWKVSSHRAVLNLINSLIEKAAPTKSFAAFAPAVLWHWKYSPTLNAHFPFCKVCDKKACDEHLESKNHEKVCYSKKACFDFEQREHLCSYGKVFHQVDGTLDSRPFLEADIPLRQSQVPVTHAEMQKVVVTRFEVLVVKGDTAHHSPPTQNTALPHTLEVRLHWLPT
jgi:hypothetical protein